MLRPQDLHIHVPQVFGEKINSAPYQTLPLCEGAALRDYCGRGSGELQYAELECKKIGHLYTLQFILHGMCLPFIVMFNDNAQYLRPHVTMATQISCNLVGALLYETLV